MRGSFFKQLMKGRKKKRLISFSAVAEAEAEAGRWWLWSVPFFAFSSSLASSYSAHTHILYCILIPRTACAFFSHSFFSISYPLIYGRLVPFPFSYYKDNCTSALLSFSSYYHHRHISLHIFERVCMCPLPLSRLDLSPKGKHNLIETKSGQRWVVLKNESMSISFFSRTKRKGDCKLLRVLSTNLWKKKRLGTTSFFYIFFDSFVWWCALPHLGWLLAFFLNLFRLEWMKWARWTACEPSFVSCCYYLPALFTEWQTASWTLPG